MDKTDNRDLVQIVFANKANKLSSKTSKRLGSMLHVATGFAHFCTSRASNSSTSSISASAAALTAAFAPPNASVFELLH